MNWIDIKDTSWLPKCALEWDEGEIWNPQSKPPQAERAWDNVSDQRVLFESVEEGLVAGWLGRTIYEDGMSWEYFIGNDGNYEFEEILRYMPIEP